MNVQTEIRIEQLQKGQTFAVPPGWAVKIVLASQERYKSCDTTHLSSAFHAVMDRFEPMAEVVERLQKEMQAALATRKEELQQESDKKLAARISSLDLLKAFDDAVKMFPIGSKAYWYCYHDYISDPVRLADIASHVREIEVNEIVYGTSSRYAKEANQVQIGDFTVAATRNGDRVVTSKVYQTKEACIAANKDEHARLVAPNLA